MKRLVLLLSVVLLVVSVSLLKADTILVPSQQPTIQAGIDTAVDGDTVLVADGTYTGDGNRDIDYGGRAIVVMSENGPENCVIDCEGTTEDRHRGFYFHSGEDESSVVQGFTIMNGYAYLGGGIYCRYDSSPTITGNTITGNTGDLRGGGIGCLTGSSPTITNNTITGNTAAGGNGGGIYCTESSPIITDNMISGNSAQEWGGGIFCDYNSSPTITDNTITGNTADYGGGIGCWISNPIITGNMITYNTASNNGGGIFCRVYSSPIITDNTISGNTAGSSGGGIYCDWFSSPTITNSILWGDSPYEIYFENVSPIVTYSDVEGGWPGEGNIDADPVFVLSDRQDHRLLWGSPCIDTGDPTLFDADGTRSDMGAHYFNQDDYLTLYMTPDATEVSQGGHMGVTYTIINRWQQKEPFSALTRVTLPDGEVRTVLGPENYEICPGYTAQIHLTYDIPPCAYLGMYEYQGVIGVPPLTLYDDDNFKFWVIE